MHAYICIHGKPNIHGEKIRDFVHHPQLEPNCYVWKNRSLTLEEHAAVARKVVEENPDLRPYTRIVVPAPAPDKRGDAITEIRASVERNRRQIPQLRQSISLQTTR